MTDRYVDIRAALEAGPTPGPWRFINHNNDPENSEPSDDWTIVSEATDKTVCSEPQCSFANLPEVCDGPYIAACHPETIRALLAERDALREALTELCDEIDKHEIHAAISKTSILWFKRKARAALHLTAKGG